jgi:uncharacterized protein Smg (DUF494 family)
MPILVVVAAAIVAYLLTEVLTKRQTRNVISGLISHATVWSGFAATQLIAPLAAPFMQAVVGAFESTKSIMQNIMAQVVTHLVGRPPPANWGEGQTTQESLLAYGEQIGRELGPELTAVVVPDHPLEGAEIPDRINKLMGLSAGFAIEDWWAHSIVELVSLGLLSAPADVSHAIAAGFGIQTLGRQTMRMLLKATLTDPLKVYANRTYTPTVLTVGETIRAWQRRLIDDDGAIGQLRDHGYTYDRALQLLNLEQKEFTLAEAEQLWRLGKIDDAKFEEIVRRQGYGDERAAVMVSLLRSGKSRTLLDEIAKEAEALYEAGHIDAAELEQLLGEAGYRREEIDLVLVREELALRKTRALSKSEVLTAYTEGVLDDSAARGILRQQRYSDDTIDVLLALQRKHLTPAELITAYAAGALRRADVVTKLQERGYSAEEAEMLLDLRTRHLSEGQIIDALRRGLLTPGGAVAKLRDLGLDVEEADLLVASSAHLVSAADVQAGLLRGLLDEPAARAKLTALGYRGTDVELLINLRFRLFSRGMVVDAYDADRITRDDAARRLEELGFEPEDAALWLDTIDALAAAKSAGGAAGPRTRRGRSAPPGPAAPPS